MYIHEQNRGSLLLRNHSVALLATIFCIVTFLASCGNDSKRQETDEQAAEEFHADNDIAMVVRSLADAISVGEQLDSTDYNFNGILTDGQGTPLYTDVQGAPGQWEVDVVSHRKAVIRNLYLGDLLPEDLESYIVTSLELDESDHRPTTEFDDDEEADLSLYDIPGGQLRFETRAGIAPNGIEGPLMSIVVAGS